MMNTIHTKLYLILPLLALFACNRQSLDQHITALQGADEQARNKAAHALTRHKDSSVPLLAPLVTSGDEVTKLLALQILEKIGTRQAALAAAPALNDAVLDVKQAALAVLAYCPLAPSLLKDIITTSTAIYAPMRLNSVPCFQQFPDSSNSIKALIHLLKDKEDTIREQAIQTLLGIGNEQVKKALLPTLAETDDQVRYIVIQALGNLGMVEATATLIAIVRNDDNTFIRQKAAISLGMLKAKEAIPTLEAMYASGSRDEKVAVQQALQLLKQY